MGLPSAPSFRAYFWFFSRVWVEGITVETIPSVNLQVEEESNDKEKTEYDRVKHVQTHNWGWGI